MNIFANGLRNIPGGKVLDVATQEGHFAQLLMDNLQSYIEIVGIDINWPAIQTAQAALGQGKTSFLVMNAERLGFADESFDTVSISASFHHLPHIPPVLNEMKRVLKRGGYFIVAEMHRDAQTEAELTSVTLHHWAAEVDTALGGLHHHTLARQELIDYVESLWLGKFESYEDTDRDSYPLEKTRIEQLDALINRLRQRLETAGILGKLKSRGEELRQRLHRVGAQREPILLIIAKKGQV